MAFFSFGKKNRSDLNKYSLVFSINSGNVAGAIVRVTDKPGVEVINYTKIMLAVTTRATASTRLLSLQSALNTLLVRLQTNGLNKYSIDSAYYIFSTPWSVSQTKTIRAKENQAFKITADYLKRIIDEHEQNFQTEIAVHGRIIERKIIQYKLNGYIVDEIVGKMARELEISIFSTVIPEDILQLVEDAVSKIVRVKNNFCHSLSLSIFSVIRDIYPFRDDFVHIDMGDELTDIVVVKDGVMSTGATFPLGRNNFVQALAENQKVSITVADSMIKIQTDKNSDPLATLGQSHDLDKLVENWAARVSDVFRSISQKVYLPETLFLIVNYDLSRLFVNKLQAQGFEILSIDRKKIKLPAGQEDLIFTIGLMFLDKIYKI